MAPEVRKLWRHRIRCLVLRQLGLLSLRACVAMRALREYEAYTKYISLRGPEMGKRARTAGRNSEIQAEHSGGEMGVQGANIWPIRANEGWC